MYVARTIEDLRAQRAGASSPLGLVPTMGSLHEGHLSLVSRARADCATVVASLFVNPAQFGPHEDLASYPRDEPRDLELFEQAGVDLVFAPTVEEIYPRGFAATVSLGGLTTVLEGARRPGHFDGVATVVTKLFNIVRPDSAYFGEKDAQQLLVIRALVRDLDLSIEIVGCPIVRAPDGLALSSRNAYLSDEQRAQALSLSRGLTAAGAAFDGGVRDAETLRAIVRGEIEAQSLAEIDYVSLAGAATLSELEGDIDGEALLSLAVRFGGTRLIDNCVLAS